MLKSEQLMVCLKFRRFNAALWTNILSQFIVYDSLNILKFLNFFYSQENL